MTTFDFAFEARYARLSRLVGVTPARSGIEIAGGRLRVRFGPWRVDTGLDNIARVSIDGPYAFVKTAGPARLGVTDRGLTFATNSRAGVRIEFVTPITGIDPLGLIHHPNLTVTAQDCAGLAALLSARRGNRPTAR